MEDDKDIPRTTKYKECSIQINYEPLDDVIRYLSEWKADHPEAIHPSLEMDEENTHIAYTVMETDKEYYDRLATTRKRNAEEFKRKQAHDYKEYLRLKKQFESIDQNNIVGQNLHGEE